MSYIINYRDGQEDSVGSLGRVEDIARKRDERGAYLRDILRGATARQNASGKSWRWDGRKRAFVAATEGGAA